MSGAASLPFTPSRVVCGSYLSSFHEVRIRLIASSEIASELSPETLCDQLGRIVRTAVTIQRLCDHLGLERVWEK